MASLATKTKKLNGIISLKDYDKPQLEIIKTKLKDFLSTSCDIYAFIVHDKDILEDGTLKTVHIHFVADLKVTCRLSTTINNISAALVVDPFAVTLDKYTSFEGSIQYLIHKNNPDKAQYQQSDIISNITADDLGNYLDAAHTAFDIDNWISIISNASTLTEVIKGIGISYYNMYRNTICDLFRQFHDGELYGIFKPCCKAEKETENDF